MNGGKTITTHSPEETVEMSSRLAENLLEGDFIALIGDLGTGKTMFVKGLAKGLRIKDYLYVNSPSFVLLKEYHGKKHLYHFDVYRLDPESFCETLDYERYFYGNGITVVEWADKIRDVLPEDYLEVGIFFSEDTERRFEFRARGKRSGAVLDNI
ncbi:MAG: tRNA (adenosine(37)-N6)-threonylcarbamoyltransferase complex ATPase subunit type 1 TsaE [Candidatus Makaraimicrobium thalassicum]|nr:MAG: tRNA (adenosine(37)-N6)-threonylcarbamoyltransferase complex ATPase subunit type 1 TsaE [Candidatus Omnitrophota bacterium]